VLNDGSSNYIYGPDGLPVEQIASNGSARRTQCFREDPMIPSMPSLASVGIVLLALTGPMVNCALTHLGGLLCPPISVSRMYQSSARVGVYSVQTVPRKSCSAG
jgi:hypothetical protein